MPVLRILIGAILGGIVGVVIQQLGLHFLAGSDGDAQGFWQFAIIPLLIVCPVVGAVVGAMRK